MYQVLEHRRTIGDRRTPIGARIVDSDNNPINLTGLTVKFKLTKEEGGSTLIDEQVATVVNAEAGLVQYELSANDITAIGSNAIVCFGFFIVYEGTLSDTHPVGRLFRIEFEESK